MPVTIARAITLITRARVFESPKERNSSGENLFNAYIYYIFMKDIHTKFN